MANELSNSIVKLADNPSQENRETFYRTFAASRVGVRVPEKFGGPPPGEYVSQGGQLPIPTSKAPDGSMMLAVLADVDDLVAREPDSMFLELSAADLIKLAQAHYVGIIVQSTIPGNDAWAAISRDYLSALKARPAG
jgi:hypothetical protein